MTTRQPPAPPAAPAPPTMPALYDQLDAVLRALLAEHERMLAITADHRRAIAEADAVALNACLERHAGSAQRVAELERQRQGIVSSLVAQIGPGRVGPGQNLSALTARAPEPVRARLASVGAALRELLNALHREHQALRAAAETLSAHMEGLMRQVCRRLSHAGTYARSGWVDSSVQVVSALDVRS